LPAAFFILQGIVNRGCHGECYHKPASLPKH
jgi:hypothetical protein